MENDDRTSADSFAEETFEVRDRRGGFLWVSNAVFDFFAKRLQSTTFMLYLALCRMANNSSQQCFPSQELLAEMIGIDERTVRRSMDELLSAKLISRKKVGRHHEYALLSIADKISAIESGQKLHGKANISYKNSGQECTPNKTYNNTQEQLSSAALPTDDFKLDSNPPAPKNGNGHKTTADLRYERFTELIFKAHQHYVKAPPHFNGTAGKNLKRLLSEDKTLTEKRLVAMLDNYHESKDHAPAEQPAFYISRLPRYETGTLNKYGRAECS